MSDNIAKKLHTDNANLALRLGVKLEPVVDPFAKLTVEEIEYIAESNAKVVFTLSEIEPPAAGHVLMNAQRPLLGDDVSKPDSYGYGRFFVSTSIAESSVGFNLYNENMKLDAYLPVSVVSKEQLNMLFFVSGKDAERYKQHKDELIAYNHNDSNKDKKLEKDALILKQHITEKNHSEKFIEFTEAVSMIENYNLAIEAANNAANIT